MALAVNEQSEAVKALAVDWPLLSALQAGTRAMRAGTTQFLPKWPNEAADSYAARVATATLFPAYRRTVGVMAGKPFAKPLTLGKDVPARLVKWAENIDLQGVNLHAFCAEMFNETVGYGLAGILVDYPDTVARDEQGAALPVQPTRTVAQVEAAGIRPYWVRVRHEQILGWRCAIKAGAMRLTQLRLMESVDEPDGDFGTVSVQQVRVLVPGGWATYRQQGEKKEWLLHRSGTTTLTEIPFAPLYGRRDGFMLGKPPLLDLAFLNVKHWQSQSDQDTILHVARVPILVAAGVDEEGWSLSVGASTAVRIPTDATLTYCEHTGASIEAGAASLAALEEQMIQTGAELLVKKPGDRSATEAAGDQEGNKCDLQRMVETFGDAVEQALLYTAQFAGEQQGGTVTLFTDFGAANLTEASGQLVISMHQAGLLSKPTTLREMQRRGELHDGIDVEAELEAVEAEGPPLGAMLPVD